MHDLQGLVFLGAIDERIIFTERMSDGADMPFFPLAHGVPRADDRWLVSGIVYVIKHGLQWKDRPKATREVVELINIDKGYTAARAAQAARAESIKLCVVKLDKTKKGFVLLPKRSVVERLFAWMTRGRRLVKGYDRYTWDQTHKKVGIGSAS